MKINFNICAFVTVLMLSLIACQQEEDVYKKEKIEIQVVGVETQAKSRAQLFTPEELLVEDNNFRLDAYYFEEGVKTYFSNVEMIYFENNWRFREWVEGTSKLIDYFWPHDEKVLNFMAIIPKDLSQSVVTEANFSFTTGGVTFTCTRPSMIDDRNDAENLIKEFTYAYTPAPTKGEMIGLRFIHPFSAIKFKLHQSHRDLKIHTITLKNLYGNGTFSCNVDTRTNTPPLSAWSTTGSTGDLTIQIEKIIPIDINFGASIGGPYLVIPQSINDITLQVDYTWKGERKYSRELPIKTDEHTAWEPGMIYTYTLDLGDNKEEILFKIKVEPWIKGENENYENEYNVE